MINRKLYYVLSFLVFILISTCFLCQCFRGSLEGFQDRDEYIKKTDYTFADVQYHDDIDTISKQAEVYGLPAGTTFVLDGSGNKYATLAGNDIKTQFTYYETGKPNVIGNYVPSYEDSVYLSKYATGLKPSLYER